VSSSGTRASNPSINGPKPSVKLSQPINESEPRLNPWNALANEIARFRPVAARANFNAPSIASVPELQKKTASRCGGVRFVNASASNPLSSEQSICTMFGRSRSSTSRIACFTSG
jgi:hypothetical protein